MARSTTVDTRRAGCGSGAPDWGVPIPSVRMSFVIIPPVRDSFSELAKCICPQISHLSLELKRKSLFQSEVWRLEWAGKCSRRTRRPPRAGNIPCWACEGGGRCDIRRHNVPFLPVTVRQPRGRKALSRRSNVNFRLD